MMLMAMASVSAVIVSASLLLRTAVCVTSAVRAEGVAAACSEAAEAADTAEAVLAACTCEKYHLLWPGDKVAPHFTTHKTGAVMKLSISTIYTMQSKGVWVFHNIRRRPFQGSSSCWKHLIALSHFMNLSRHYEIGMQASNTIKIYPKLITLMGTGGFSKDP